jgi:hypothetical protein
MADSKFVKLEVRFKCPVPECGMGDATNGAECLRCVLIHIMGDQQMWDESQRRKTDDQGVVDISAESIPEVEQQMTEEDLEFLASPAYVLLAQREWGGPELDRAVELYRGKTTSEPADILELPQETSDVKVHSDE